MLDDLKRPPGFVERPRRDLADRALRQRGFEISKLVAPFVDLVGRSRIAKRRDLFALQRLAFAQNQDARFMPIRIQRLDPQHRKVQFTRWYAAPWPHKRRSGYCA